MASDFTNIKINNLFSKFPPDSKFFWYSTEEERYIGFLNVYSGGQHIDYARSMDDILLSLHQYHINHIPNVVIFPECDTAGLPDALSPVFIGSEWLGEWDAVE